jgi:hypothetical protein
VFSTHRLKLSDCLSSARQGLRVIPSHDSKNSTSAGMQNQAMASTVRLTDHATPVHGLGDARAYYSLRAVMGIDKADSAQAL